MLASARNGSNALVDSGVGAGSCGIERYSERTFAMTRFAAASGELLAYAEV